MRPDDPKRMFLHTGQYNGGKALIVLGGYSGKDWQSLRDEVEPDVILIGNGVNSQVQNADYWLCVENMNTWTRGGRMTREDPKRSAELMEMFYREAGAKTKLISHWSWGLLKDVANCICIRRAGYDLDNIPFDFSFRSYGEGFLSGGISKCPASWQRGVKVRAGTVGLQLLHLAGILGCAEVHTIGFDLCFKNGTRHHFYNYPKYQADLFRSPAMFTEYKGLDTQWIWIETMEYLKGIEPLMWNEGLFWKDHSHGLLEMEGIAK